MICEYERLSGIVPLCCHFHCAKFIWCSGGYVAYISLKLPPFLSSQVVFVLNCLEYMYVDESFGSLEGFGSLQLGYISGYPCKII